MEICINVCSIKVVNNSMQLYDIKEITREQKKLSLAYDHHKIDNNNSKF